MTTIHKETSDRRRCVFSFSSMGPTRTVAPILIIFLASLSLGWAADKPTKKQLQSYANDGSLNNRIRNVMALGNHAVAPDLVRDFRVNIDRIRLTRTGEASFDQNNSVLSQTRNVLRSNGAIKIFALLISFADYPPNQNPESVASKLFGDGEGGWPYESLRNYYHRSSYNALDIQGNVLGWYDSPYARSSLPQTPAARESLVKEALIYFQGQGHDFSQYDNDGDGDIDYFMVIWSGPDNGWGGFWWGYQTSLSDRNILLSGKKLLQTRYAWLKGEGADEAAFDPKPAIHETGHAFGLPDYYDYDNQAGPPGGIGGLDMMDGARGDHNAFSKMLLGWITPQVFEFGTKDFTLIASGTSPDALLVIPESSRPDPPDVFFLLQNRFRSENDFYLPEDQLQIWRVDASIAREGHFQNDNSIAGRSLLTLIEGNDKGRKPNMSPASSFAFPIEGKCIELELDPAHFADSLRLYAFGFGPSLRIRSSTDDSRGFASTQQIQLIPDLGSENGVSSVSAGFQAMASGAIYYVDATHGSDLNSGLTPDQPWKTINKVNHTVFVPGDTILFERGETWRETLIPPSPGASGNNITFGAYGTGNLPMIDGSGRAYCIDGRVGHITIADLHFVSPSQYGIAHTRWDNAGAELSTPGWMIMNSRFSRCGAQLFGPDTLVRDNVFVGPSPITGSDGAIVIRGKAATHCSILRNTISGFAYRGVWILNAAHSPTVNDNTIYNIGLVSGIQAPGIAIDFDGYGAPITGTVTCLGNKLSNCATYGICVENCSEGSLFQGNIIHDSRDGIGFINYKAGFGYADQRGLNINAVVAYNVIYHAKYALKLIDVSLVNIWNNVLYDGKGIGAYGLVIDAQGRYNARNIDFRNNIVGSGMAHSCNVAFAWENHFSAFDYNAVMSPVLFERDTLTSLTLTQLRAGGAALHNFSTAPLFVNAAEHDFHLLLSSPCIDAGVSVGLTQDHSGNAIEGPPDIGAHESLSSAPIGLPLVTTMSPSIINAKSAVGGGNVTSDSGTMVTERGVCWALTANPTIQDAHTHDGSGTGRYTSRMTGLKPAERYHVRAYATNSSGTAYGEDVTCETRADERRPYRTLAVEGQKSLQTIDK